MRALPKAPVATPLHWEELSDRRLSPQGWTVKTIQDRLADGGDPWQRDRAHGPLLPKSYATSRSEPSSGSKTKPRT